MMVLLESTKQQKLVRQSRLSHTRGAFATPQNWYSIAVNVL
jgi:hypothetical protein